MVQKSPVRSPALNDAEIEAILAEAAKAGATQAGYILLRLPLEIKDLFNEWLEAHVPDKAKHVMSLLKSMRGGKEYDSRWGVRMRGSGPYAQLLGQRFRLAVRRLGLNQNNTPLDTGKFRRPRDENAQLALAI